MKRIVLLLLLGSATPTLAQSVKNAAANPAVATVRALWEPMRDYITQAAEEMSEADYAFRPTPEVRTFGQLIGHIAGAQYLICAAALGERGRSEDDIEKSRTTKAALIEALRASSEYCARAYSQSDASAVRPTKLFGQERSRLFALGLNATHDAEHYGNIVTYMRMKGMVPPSSRASP